MAIKDKLHNGIKEHWSFCFVVVIALFAFSLRYWLYMRYHNPLMLHEQDGIAYMANAKDILSFKFPSNLYMPPFYSLVIALFSFLPVKLEAAARIASITMDALVTLPLFGIARIFLPRIASLVVCGLWATFYFSLFYAPSPLSQSTYLFMLLSGTFLLYRATLNGAGLWLYALSGACLSAAYQTRPEGIVSLAVGLFLVAICSIRNDADRLRQIKGSAIFLLLFAVAALPYLLALHAQLGHWTFTAKTTVAIKGVDGSLELASMGGKAKNGVALWLEQFGGITGGLSFIKANIGGFFKLFIGTFPKWTHLFALAGLVFMFFGKNLIYKLFLLIPIMVTFPVCVVNLPKDSAYIYPLYPLYLLAFVAGLWGLLSLLGKLGNSLFPAIEPKILPPLFSILLLLTASLISINSWNEANANFQNSDYLYQVEITDKILRAAGEKLQSLSSSKEPVMTRWGLITYFAERPFIGLPKGNVADVIDYGRKNGAKLIVIDTGTVETRRQELAELLNPLYGGGINVKYGIQVVGFGKSEVGGYVIFRYI